MLNGEIPILLVAHLDTVHKEIPKQIFFDKSAKVMWSPQGIGGDDRCGVFAILKILEEYEPYILFTTEEETGGKGARKFTNEFLWNLKDEICFMIEIDRRGDKQAVFYDCGNDDFINYILDFGFKEEYGSFSDICILSKAYDIASVNLSAGYYNEHTKEEIIDLNATYNTINTVKLILADTENFAFYDYQEVVYNNYYDNITKKEKKPKEKKTNGIIQEIDEYFIKLEQDYNKLSNAEFKDKYGYAKPSTIEELYDY